MQLKVDFLNFRAEIRLFKLSFFLPRNVFSSLGMDGGTLCHTFFYLLPWCPGLLNSVCQTFPPPSLPPPASREITLTSLSCFCLGQLHLTLAVASFISPTFLCFLFGEAGKVKGVKFSERTLISLTLYNVKEQKNKKKVGCIMMKL